MGVWVFCWRCPVTVIFACWGTLLNLDVLVRGSIVVVIVVVVAVWLMLGSIGVPLGAVA